MEHLREDGVQLRTTTSQKCEADPRRSRTSGSQTCVSLNSRLENDREEEEGGDLVEHLREDWVHQRPCLGIGVRGWGLRVTGLGLRVEGGEIRVECLGSEV